MASHNKNFETGSSPYHLNLNNTVKDFSTLEATNPQFGLLDLLTKFIVITDEQTHLPLQLTNDLTIVDEKKGRSNLHTLCGDLSTSRLV